MFEVLLTVQLLGLIGLASLFYYVFVVKSELSNTLETNNNDIKQGMVFAIEQITQVSQNAGSSSYKDAKHMMELRLEEFKFMMLSKAGEYFSNKFLKTPMGIHQIMPPDEDNDNKPLEPTE